MEIIILVVLIILNGIFAMSEIALVTARKSRLLSKIALGDKKAKLALSLGENPTQFLSTIQIGITSIGILSGIFGETALAIPLSHKLQAVFSLPQSTANLIATISVVTIITFFSIIIGELVPKRLGQLNPENIACLVARPMYILSIISKPFIILLSFSTSLVLKLFKSNEDENNTITEEEIQAIINESSDNGTIHSKQKELIHNIFRLDDRPVNSIMIPKRKITYLNIQDTTEESINILKNANCTYLPVCDGDIDNIIGLIHSKQALMLLLETNTHNSSILATNSLKPYFIPERITTLDLLKIFQQKGLYLAFVIDEYGIVQGMLTIRNLLSILAGQVEEDNEENWAKEQDENSWILNGSIPILELKDKLQITELPNEEKGYYSILNGFITYLSGNIPKKGDIIEWNNWKFEILEMDGTKINKLIAHKISMPTTQYNNDVINNKADRTT